MQKSHFIKEEKRAEYIKKIIGFFATERNEEIGVVAGGEILDFFSEEIGKEIYKEAIADTKKIIKEKVEDLDIALDLLSEK
jgi:uncharacterized protein (DUF2164 family)